MIKGAGGGGKGGGGSSRTPVEADDTLRSKQYARVLDAVSEGPIRGLANGFQSVFLDDTPLQNRDGTFNFTDVTITERTGTQDQDHIAGFSAVESEIGVNTEITYDTPVVRSISNADIDAARITISIPRLTVQSTSTGDINGTSVQLAIDVQSNGGGYVAQNISVDETVGYVTSGVAYGTGLRLTANVSVTQRTYTVSGKTRKVYPTLQFSYRVNQGAWIVISNSVATGNTMIVKTPELGVVSNIEMKVEITANAGAASFTSCTSLNYVAYDTITGKTTSTYNRSYYIPLTGDAPWDIRVRRLTPDSTQSTLVNQTTFSSYTEVINEKLRYPNTALVGVQVNAEQFSTIPKRSYDLYGLIIRVPSNYDPSSREYTGVWDGTFKLAWSDNPAWVFYDLLTEERYGLGAFITEDQVDKWELYSIAQYCDELVSDGFGGYEPRFTCNLYLQSQEEAYTVINNLAGVFRGMSYWASGAIYVSQDKPSDPVKLFTNANVIDGAFSYQGSAKNARHTVALVSWNDPSDHCEQKIEYVADEAGIERYGVISTDVVAFGCNSRGQAHRVGKWILYTERFETEVASFQIGIENATVYPGEICQIADRNRAGARIGGRVVSATTTQITLDSAVTISAGESYSLWCMLPDGSLESKDLSMAAGSHTVITVYSAFTTAPQNGAIWVLSASNLEPTLWRVISIEENDDGNANVTALKHYPQKYDLIENDIKFELPPTSIITARPNAVTNLMVVESLYESSPGIVSNRVTISWTGTTPTYRVTYRVDSGNPVVNNNQTTNTLTIDNAPTGLYSVSVVAVNAAGAQSAAQSVTKTVMGKGAPPNDITGLIVLKSSGIAIPQWDLSPDLDVRVGGRIVFRHSPLTSGATWQNGVILDEFDGNSVSGILPLMTGTYMAKAKDSSGNWAANAVSFVATEGMVTGFNTVATSTQHPLFSGVKDHVSANDGTLYLDSALTIDEMLTEIDSWGYIDASGGIDQNGTYYFDSVMDLSTKAVRRFEVEISSLSVDADDLINSRSFIDEWESVDGNVINDCDATIYISMTDDDPNVSPVWGDYIPFFVGDFDCRAARFKTELSSDTSTHNIYVSGLTVKAKIPA